MFSTAVCCVGSLIFVLASSTDELDARHMFFAVLIKSASPTNDQCLFAFVYWFFSLYAINK